MTSFTKSLSTLALVLPVLMYSGPAKAEMTGDQIRAAVSGKTLSFIGDYNGTANFATDGSASMTLNDGTKITGKWRVEGNTFCTHWDRTEEQCATWKSFEGRYLTSTGYTMTPQ